MNYFAFRIWGSLPDSVRIPLDILRRCPRWKKGGVLFVHVPKAAGVSVNRALYGRPLGHFKAMDIRRVCPKTFHNLLTFGVVRNPVDRLRSAYQFARTGRTVDMGIKNPKLYQSDIFSTFDKFVCEWLIKQDVTKLDGVFRPQYLYLCDGKKIVVDKVIKLEQLESGIKELSEQLNKEITLGHYNKSPVVNNEPMLSSTRSVIEDIYKADFDIFSY